jgi:hypothetical protein
MMGPKRTDWQTRRLTTGSSGDMVSSMYLDRSLDKVRRLSNQDLSVGCNKSPASSLERRSPDRANAATSPFLRECSGSADR